MVFIPNSPSQTEITHGAALHPGHFCSLQVRSKFLLCKAESLTKESLLLHFAKFAKNALSGHSGTSSLVAEFIQ